MDFNQAQIDLLLWITGFVEQPNAQLGGWPPCPYARRARLNGEFEIRQGRVDPYLDLQQVNLNVKQLWPMCMILNIFKVRNSTV